MKPIVQHSRRSGSVLKLGHSPNSRFHTEKSRITLHLRLPSTLWSDSPLISFTRRSSMRKKCQNPQTIYRDWWRRPIMISRSIRSSSTSTIHSHGMLSRLQSEAISASMVNASTYAPSSPLCPLPETEHGSAPSAARTPESSWSTPSNKTLSNVFMSPTQSPVRSHSWRTAPLSSRSIITVMKMI